MTKKIFTMRSNQRDFWAAKLILPLMLALSFLPAQAATFTWTGNESKDWNTASNWSPVGIPGSADTAIIGRNEDVRTDTDISVAQLNIDAASRLSGTGNIRILGGSNLTDVRLGGTGDVIIASGAVVNITTVGTNNGPLVGVTGATGTVNTRFDGNIYNYGIINWKSGNLLAYKGFRHLSSSTFNITSNGYLIQDPAFPTTAEIYGKLSKTSSGNSIFTMPTNNRGRLEASGGTLDFRNGFTQVVGTTHLGRGTIKCSSALKYLGGRLDGTGVVNAPVTNQSAVVAPGNSPGSIVINGNYVQAANGTLQMEIGGLVAVTNYDQLTVNGAATLGGTLDLVSYAGFAPRAGDSFQLVKYLSVSGEFATLTNSFATPGTYFSTSKTPSYLVAQTNADAALPTVTVTAPVSNQASASLATTSGTASDSLSGLAAVTVRLYRYAAGAVTAGYWNGITWTAAYSAANELLATGTTSWSKSLPVLAEGKYSIIATAKDKANNSQLSTEKIFWIDSSTPATVTFISPVHNAVVTNINSANGTASDAVSGIIRVDLRIKKLSDNTYWNGTTWVAALTNLSTVLNGTNWSRTNGVGTAMPAGASLPNGLYTLTANAVDRANLSRAAVATVNVQAAAPAPAASQYQMPSIEKPAQLISSQANGANVTLVFSAPLDEVLIGAANFSLQLNDMSVAPQKISAVGETVTIELPAESLAIAADGSVLIISWDNLHDGGGHTVSGQTSLSLNVN